MHSLSFADNSAKHSYEFKISIEETDLRKILKTRYLDWNPSAEKRTIFFFDDAHLTLYKKHLSLRARADSELETTAKVRPIDYEKIGDDWLKYDGFKCETDMQMKHRETPSCSFSANPPMQQLQQVLNGEKTPKALFKKEQERFANELGSPQIDWAQLIPLGPTHSQTWHGHSPSAFSSDLTLELWSFSKKGKPAQNVLELSISAKKRADFEKKRAWLIDLVLREQWLAKSVQETKTAIALRYFTE